eukprot:IDg22181t1
MRRVRRTRRLLHRAVQIGLISVQIRLIRKLQMYMKDAQSIRTRSVAISCAVFNINAYSNEDCLRNFRFTSQELPRIMRLVDWKRSSTTRNRYSSHSALSEVFYENAWALFDNCSSLVMSYRSNLIFKRAALYASAIVENGGALTRCIGFIDGTKIKMPDLVVQIIFKEAWRQPDAYLYRKSQLEAALRDNLVYEGEQHYIYGDSAYVLRPWLQTAYPRSTATEEQRNLNRSMNGARTAVEWSYGEVKRYFTTQDFSRKLQVKKLPVALLYACSVLLVNFKTCLGHHTSASSYFSCPPPTLEEYCSL